MHKLYIPQTGSASLNHDFKYRFVTDVTLMIIVINCTIYLRPHSEGNLAHFAQS